MKSNLTFTTAYVVASDSLLIASSPDIHDPYERFTRVWRWYRDTPTYWHYIDLPWRTISVTAFVPESGDLWWTCTLSEEGEVSFQGRDGVSSEKIPGAGVFSSDSQGWGYMSDLQQIGDHLYACGFNGQVYRRNGPNNWVHMDKGILQPKEMVDGNYSPAVINGPHERAIYLAGCIQQPYYPVRASFWDGSIWRDLVLPEVADRITAIHVESESRIWMCGENGTLLLGNAVDGFKSLSTTDDNQLFLSICGYKGKIYLGTLQGPYCYDPARPQAGITKVKTGLSPELIDGNIVDKAQNVLWSIGNKDIARFDGKSWSRIHHPDNPRI